MILAIKEKCERKALITFSFLSLPFFFLCLQLFIRRGIGNFFKMREERVKREEMQKKEERKRERES